MGIYVFASLTQPWFKVGHHRVTERRPNVYFRVAGRGFHSCRHPPQLTRLGMDDLELVAWYPDLTSRQERALHRANAAQGVGEWYPNAERARLLAALDALGRRAEVGAADRERARAWAGGRGRRALK